LEPVGLLAVRGANNDLCTWLDLNEVDFPELQDEQSVGGYLGNRITRLAERYEFGFQALASLLDPGDDLGHVERTGMAQSSDDVVQVHVSLLVSPGTA